jgi:hypothetical protein
MGASFMNRRIVQGPKMMASDPPDGATGVAPGAAITMRFNKPVHPWNFVLYKLTPPIDVNVGKATAYVGGDQTLVRVTPTAPMTASCQYKIYERVGFPITDTQNKERIHYGVPFPFTWTIA